MMSLLALIMLVHRSATVPVTYIEWGDWAPDYDPWFTQHQYEHNMEADARQWFRFNDPDYNLRF